MFCRRRGLSLFRYYTTSTRAKLKSEPLIFKPTFSRAPTEAGKIGPLTHHKFLTLDTMASNTIEPATVVKELETVEIQVEYSKETPIETTQVAKEIQVETLNNATMTSVTTMDSDSHAGHVRTVEELGDEPAVGPPPTKKVRVDKKSSKKADKKMRRLRKTMPEHCSPEDVQWQDIVALLGKDVVDQAIESETEFTSPFEKFEELEVKVVHMCSNGTWLALRSDY